MEADSVWAGVSWVFCSTNIQEQKWDINFLLHLTHLLGLLILIEIRMLSHFLSVVVSRALVLCMLLG